MLDSLLSLSPTLKLGLTLLSVVVLMRLRLHMGGALLAGSCLLELFFPLPFRGFVNAVFYGLTNQNTVFLLFILAGLLVFSGALNETGQIRHIIAALHAMIGSSRISLIAFPALIGLLPMPGGAIFSAPMVGAAVEGSRISPARTTVANYWFRHIWEYWFPLYPGVILFFTLTNAPAAPYILMQLPMTLCSLAIGYFVILRGIRLAGESRRDFTPVNVRRFVHELTPILLVVACVAVISGIFGLLWPVGFDPTAGGGLLFRARSFLHNPAVADNIFIRRSPLLIGLLLGWAWLFAHRGLTLRTLGKLALQKHVVSMLALVLGLGVFQSVLETSGAVQELSLEFENGGVALTAVICAVPFVCGLVVGIAYGFVGASFPLVVLLLSNMTMGEKLPYYCLAYVMGYVGMMLSPVHICLVITNEYFKSRLLRAYAYLLPAGLLTAAFGVALFLLYRFFL